MLTARPLWLFFLSSIWLLLIYSGYQAVDYLVRAGDIMESTLPGYGARVVIAPLLLFGGEFVLWLKLFRHERPGARIMAGLVGILLLLLIFVMAVSADLWQKNYPGHLYWIFSYVAAGHLVYAMFGRERKW